ncbi:TetR/AcrR family transcriptional regulator [Mycobacterium sp. 236(2023)]|uniref:TetR/AcrR family transcriptional regulator n=1 Tax=Mycobacterium sp. 236(2023) TaxID=3038163 RepID=UPI0024158127|nr:TetR/AcrR family transcriptional regulator [Mycobacterium sp. 236(2023)]MDG4669180.1 TetR/AcrR family transcriptional regulator [Mycobacterium sp. 236(2023)]
MRSRGWAGATPESDEAAIDRILDAVDDVIVTHGPVLRLADVARRLGVTRQTVYHYFPNADALLVASTMRAVNGLIDQVVHRVVGQTDPVTALVESVAFAVENLIGDPQLEALLCARKGARAVISLTSDTAITFCLALFDRMDVDWALHGFDPAELAELSEMVLRTVHSFLADPGQTPRQGPALRRFIAHWLGPAILHPQTKSIMSLGGQ